MTPIYLDNNATTACDPAVVEAMLPYFTEQFGNASSMHSFGNKVAQGLRDARISVQRLLGAEFESEIIFTSCGTESDSTAILSALRAQPERKQIITTVVEHPAILETCRALIETRLDEAGFTYTLAARYSGKQHNQLDNLDTNPDTYGGTSQYFLVDAKVVYRVAKQWSASLGVDNLNNYKAYVAHPWPQRTVFAGVKFDY